MAYETIKYDVKDHVATITLYRPEKMNAYNGQMLDDLVAAFDAIDADDDVRAVVVTGDGRAFCAGADLTPSGGGQPFEKPDYDSLSHPEVRDKGGLLTLRIHDCNKPVIAAVNGAAIGIGATMLTAMDIRLGSTKCKFGFVFVRRGIVPEAASSWFLPRIVNMGTALEWCLTGRMVEATEAQERGFLRSLHEPEDLLPAAYAIAREIADNAAPVSVTLTRHMLWRLSAADHPMAAHKIDSRGIYRRGKSNDVKEGVAAFLEKRDAVYPDRVSRDMPDYFPWWNQPEYD